MSRDIIMKIFEKYIDYKGEHCVPVVEIVGSEIGSGVDEIWDVFKPFTDMGWVAEKIKYLEREINKLKGDL